MRIRPFRCEICYFSKHALSWKRIARLESSMCVGATIELEASNNLTEHLCCSFKGSLLRSLSSASSFWVPLSCGLDISKAILCLFFLSSPFVRIGHIKGDVCRNGPGAGMDDGPTIWIMIKRCGDGAHQTYEYWCSRDVRVGKRGHKLFWRIFYFILKGKWASEDDSPHGQSVTAIVGVSAASYTTKLGLTISQRLFSFPLLLYHWRILPHHFSVAGFHGFLHRIWLAGTGSSSDAPLISFFSFRLL